MWYLPYLYLFTLPYLDDVPQDGKLSLPDLEPPIVHKADILQQKEKHVLLYTPYITPTCLFTQGSQNLVVSLGHKPLLCILNDRDLSSITNPPVQNLKEKLFRWEFEITYNPGDRHCGPDAVSRNAVSIVSLIRVSPNEADFSVIEKQVIVIVIDSDSDSDW